jgi:hypothetical protein
VAVVRRDDPAFLREVTEKVGAGIARGEVTADVGHALIGGYAAWLYAAELDVALSIGTPLSDTKPSAIYATAIQSPDEYARFTEALARVGMVAPWRCGDCAVLPGERHEEGCDVARCVGCGQQALQCDRHLDRPMQTWTGRWPGSEEIEEGLARDLNHLAACGLGPEPILLWDRDLERWRKP